MDPDFDNSLCNLDDVQDLPPTKAIVKVYAKFNRIATTNLENDFFDALDCFTPRFVHIFKSKKGSVEEKLAEIVQQVDSGDSNDNEGWAQNSKL
ncbi:hypothetical protein HF521_006876 [Silurus meridionalis]|uniref:Uncharacterized protein n=1 Tax=Silurus meridionalis TaxID=175797 RepID=A0A8T0AV77_SILME|nr:hypothetical protein HF521_006876 [Silurus meridionalis]